MKEPIWVFKQAILHLHGVSLARFGGASGMRDEGLFDGALARPLNLFHYGGENDLAAFAAAYAFGIAKDHPFIDGNKRTAFLACGVFLDINGSPLAAMPDDAISAMLALAAGTIGEAHFAAWIRANHPEVPNPDFR